MASYNTVPDLESEAQPLAGAPPRKHGKAMLAVVAALAFGAGALAPSAAARVGLTRFDAGGGESDVAGATGQRKSLDNPWADVAGENGTPDEGVTEPAGGQFKMTDASVNNAAGASADCEGGEHVDNPGCNTAASNAGKGGVTAATYIDGRK